MSITARLMYLHIAPRKVRLAADLIRGKKVEKARTVLSFLDKRAGVPLLKLLNSAIANSRNNFHKEDIANLYISKILVNEGPKHKRWRPASRGRANEIRKRNSHIILELGEMEKSVKSESVAKAKIQKDKEEEPINQEISQSKDASSSLKVKERKVKPIFEKQKPTQARGLKRVFRRKAF